MNLSWKAVVAALIAAFLTGCSAQAAKPNPELPTTSTQVSSPSQSAPKPSISPAQPTSAPSPCPEDQPPINDPELKDADLWQQRSLEGSENNEGAADAAAFYGLSVIRTANVPDYESVGLLEDEQYLVFFQLPAINGGWPVFVSVMPRFQDEGIEPYSSEGEVENLEALRTMITTLKNELRC